MVKPRPPVPVPLLPPLPAAAGAAAAAVADEAGGEGIRPDTATGAAIEVATEELGAGIIGAAAAVVGGGVGGGVGGEGIRPDTATGAAIEVATEELGAGIIGAEGAEGGVAIEIIEGTIGAAGVGVIVAVNVSYLTFLSLSKSPDRSLANSLNFISLKDLPPIVSSKSKSSFSSLKRGSVSFK